jgi:putative multiple sugar transport system substrate-binding protein
MIKKSLSLVLILVLVTMLAACGGEATGSGGESGTVGISMPTQSSERWINDGRNMVAQFEELGYNTNLQYAEDVIENQIDQIENMITRGVDALVIAPIDGDALTEVLDLASSMDIPVISYDRLIRGSEHVSYYATFDNFQVGVLQGQFIEESLGLADGEGPFNIEIFAGSPDDNNAYFFFDGAMSVIQPYIDNGQLVVQSGQTDFQQGATLRWDGSLAQERMDNLLSGFYSDKTLDAVLSPFDGISIGVISSLKGVGYGSADLPLPVVTGQDAERPSIVSIIAGEQSHTIFKDTRELASKAVHMADAVLKGEEAEVNDTETYENGAKVVPSYLLEPTSVDINNYEEVLVDSGYYDESDLE